MPKGPHITEAVASCNLLTLRETTPYHFSLEIDELFIGVIERTDQSLYCRHADSN
jgi:hypothetical protein